MHWDFGLLIAVDYATLIVLLLTEDRHFTIRLALQGSIYPNCTTDPRIDEWTINAQRVLNHADNIIEDCHQ